MDTDPKDDSIKAVTYFMFRRANKLPDAPDKLMKTGKSGGPTRTLCLKAN